jgi:hypothetical protein
MQGSTFQKIFFLRALIFDLFFVEIKKYIEKKVYHFRFLKNISFWKTTGNSLYTFFIDRKKNVQFRRFFTFLNLNSW